MGQPLLTLLAALLLAACAHPTGGAPPVVYACDDGSQLSVRFEPELARVTLATGEELSLPQQRAASGIWYATPRHELRGKGGEATWTTGRRVPVACRVKP